MKQIMMVYYDPDTDSCGSVFYDDYYYAVKQKRNAEIGLKWKCELYIRLSGHYESLDDKLLEAIDLN